MKFFNRKRTVDEENMVSKSSPNARLVDNIKTVSNIGTLLVSINSLMKNEEGSQDILLYSLRDLASWAFEAPRKRSAKQRQGKTGPELDAEEPESESEPEPKLPEINSEYIKAIAGKINSAFSKSDCKSNVIIVDDKYESSKGTECPSNTLGELFPCTPSGETFTFNYTILNSYSGIFTISITQLKGIQSFEYDPKLLAKNDITLDHLYIQYFALLCNSTSITSKNTTKKFALIIDNLSNNGAVLCANLYEKPDTIITTTETVPQKIFVCGSCSS